MAGRPQQPAPAEQPESFHFYGNYPNPFNPKTTFRFYVPWSGSVTLKIYNYLGQLVRAIKNPHFPKGGQKLIWDGKNDYGSRVSSGLYFTRFVVQSFSENKERHVKFSKVILIK